jgi:Terminase large subunit, T4likevirus-type, N-terminal
VVGPRLELGSDLALALDPVSFARSVGLEPDDWQIDALRSHAPRQLYNTSRQSGKSTAAALLAVHTALFTRALVLLLSPTLRQSGELFKKCLDFYSAAGRPVPPESETALTLSLANGSRIVSLPGHEGTVRGYSAVALLVIDEASRVSDLLYASVRPMLAVSQGRLIALSTPDGMRGWWYEAYRSPDEEWERYEVAATEIPRISPGFLEEERLALPARIFRQEYLCSFEATEDQVFSLEDVDRAITDDVVPLFGEAS